MSLGVGCVGMGVQDFLLCTPYEFRSIYDRWRQLMDEERRERWEQARMMCLCQLQPWSKRPLKASDVMRFPWDEDEEKKQEHTPEPDHAELMERYRRAREQFGLS